MPFESQGPPYGQRVGSPEAQYMEDVGRHIVQERRNEHLPISTLPSPIAHIHQRYMGLIQKTGVQDTDSWFAKNQDQVIADLFLLIGYIAGHR